MEVLMERVVQRRRTLLLGSAIGFTLWTGARLLRESGVMGGPVQPLLIGLELAGWLVWVVALVRTLASGRGVPPRVRAAANDELVRHRRSVSFTIAAFAMLAAQAVIIVAAREHPDARIAAQVTILVGVLAATGSFLYLDRE